MSLVPKIERGEFVDLEKLLLKDPTKKLGEDGRMELTNKDGSLFFVPAADREQGKISGIRKWEQAFHVYAAIYSRANPQRSVEIWQYVYIINLASTSYSWDNMACYDYAFRQLMGRHACRFWSTIFQQMWSLSMRDSVQQQTGYNGNGGNRSRNNNNQNKAYRDNYWWCFNKNRCKFGTRCKFDHICYYCDMYGHGLYNCSKKNAKN